MAHYRRKRSAQHTRSGYSSRHSRPGTAAYHYWMQSWPAWWDIIFLRRPHRRRTRELENAILRGHLDPDAVAWPLHKKPHIYYW